MNISSALGASQVQVGVGVRMLNVAQSQTEMVSELLPDPSSGSVGLAASEAKGLFVDTYA